MRASIPRIYLASTSPRRKVLLSQIGVQFELLNNGDNEKVFPGESAAVAVKRLAIEKAEFAFSSSRKTEDWPVLAADTMVVLEENILGKPQDQAHAMAMLRHLSGREHCVFSAVAIQTQQLSECLLSKSLVRFRKLKASEIKAYCETGDPMDKAGAYGIQSVASLFIESISGSYSGIMGLPLYETGELLARVGIEPLS